MKYILIILVAALSSCKKGGLLPEDMAKEADTTQIVKQTEVKHIHK